MKVLLINTVCGIGSTGRICTDIATELDKQGHTVKIAYGRGDVPQEFQKYAFKITTNTDVRLHALKARLLDASGFGSKTNTIKFVNWIKEYNPDVIHLHNIHGYYLNIKVLFDYLKTSNKKIIWTLHDCWAFTGHSAYCDAVDCTKWQTQCNNCPQLKEYPKAYIDRSTNNYELKKLILTNVPNITIVTPSNWLKSLVEKSFLKEYPIEVIHNGVDTNIFKPTPSDLKKKYNLEDKKVVLGVASVWDSRKGLNTFIELSKLLPDDYQILLVGLTKKQINSLPSNVVGLEKTNNLEELAKFYTIAYVYVNPTLDDTYPTTNLEALACNTPVITYRTGGSVESASKVVDRNDINELCKAIISNDFSINNSLEISKNNLIKKYIGLY